MMRRIIIGFFSSLLCLQSFGFAMDKGELLKQRIKDKVEHFIGEQIVADSFDVRIDVPASVGPGIEIQDVTDIRIDWRKGSNGLMGRVVIPVCVIVQGKTSVTTYTRATICLFDRVFVSKVLLNRHHILTGSDIRKEMRDVTGLSGSPYKDVESLLEKRTKRVVGKGRVITDDMIESPPLICRGDRVELVLVYGNLKVTTTGFARKDGWLGDRIRIRGTKNQGEIIGRVISSKEVEVQL